MPETCTACPICGTASGAIGSVRSDFSQIDFQFCRCETCGLTFIPNHRTDFGAVYDAEYYSGRGADSFVNYLEEMANPRTVRSYEWQGITEIVSSVCGRRDVEWLDFGCGLGGLVRYARDAGFPSVHGFDEGWSAEWAGEHGIALLTKEELKAREGSFDMVTAIEVIEHVPDPVSVMEQVAALLKPGGTFFLTTGNAEPHRDRLLRWSYVHPDVHISYFEPRTLTSLYRGVGLEPFAIGFHAGFTDIIRYKVLKTLGVSSRNTLERLVPWSVASRIVDRRHRVTAQPLARKPIHG